MKIAPNGTNTRRRVVPPIGLDRPEAQELEKGQYQRYKLRNVPDDDNSPTYELTVPYFATGTPEEWLKFRKNLKKVLVGQNVTNGPGRYTVARRLLEGDALARFNHVAEANGNETVPNFDKCLDEVTAHVFPKRALQTQKRFMRRFLRKPPSLKIREYVARVVEINDMLELFPPSKEGETATKLPSDEILDLLEFGLPNTWQKNMVLQDFDPLAGDTNDFVAFCERMEQFESTDGGSTTGSKASKQKASGGSKASKDSASGRSKKRRRAEVITIDDDLEGDGPVCLLHGPGHSTNECKVLKEQAKKMKANWAAQHPKKKKAFQQKQELNAIVSSAVEEALKKKASKKRKAKTEEMKMIDNFEMLSLSASDASLDSDLDESSLTSPDK